MLAFGRLAPGQRRADVLLARGARTRRLGRGSIAPGCRPRCPAPLPRAWPSQLDLGPHAVAYLWQLQGGYTAGDSASELRVARLDGTRARLVESGFVSATCAYAEPISPNLSGTRVLYGFVTGAHGCARTTSAFRRFDLRSARRAQAAWSRPPDLVSLAWDTRDLYWLRQIGGRDDCDASDPRCRVELVRAANVAFKPMMRREAVPPIIAPP